MNLWIQDEVGHDAIGQPPESVARRAFALTGARARRHLRREPLATVVEHGR